MIVVVVIGILAALALPAFQRVQERSLVSRLANDFRQFEAAFQRHVLESGSWPPPADAGEIPPGMSGHLPTAFTQTSPLGGNYLWSGPSHSIVLRNSQARDTIMQRVDALLDDGDLTTGHFAKTAGVGYHFLVH